MFSRDMLYLRPQQNFRTGIFWGINVSFKQGIPDLEEQLGILTWLPKGHNQSNTDCGVDSYLCEFQKKKAEVAFDLVDSVRKAPVD